MKVAGGHSALPQNETERNQEGLWEGLRLMRVSQNANHRVTTWPHGSTPGDAQDK